MRSLYTKLAIVLVALFCLIGGVFLGVTAYSAHMYQLEVSQRLNRDLAGYVVEEKRLTSIASLDAAALEDVFHMLMVINPSVELYLLDVSGQVLSYSGAPDVLKRPSVAVEPIERFLRDGSSLPILGDDPRSRSARKAFSAAPIDVDGQRKGYIYAILASEQMEGISQMLESSYILRISSWGIAAALAFGLLTALTVFAFLTRRLRRLSGAMDELKQSDFSEAVTIPAPPSERNDELDRLTRNFIEMAARIQAQVEKLRETDSLRRELVANVSHDLRTPLASLQGYLETLQVKEAELCEADRRTYLATALRHAEQLNDLIQELFELARLDSRETRPHPEPFSLTELVQDVVQKFRLEAEQKGVRLCADFSNRALFAEADIGMIERVLDNLIENALRHTPSGGSVDVVLATESDGVSVKVVDDGAGIPESDLPYVFERFYRIDNEQAPATGSGLGLAIASRIVELHGTRLSVSSHVDQGTQFDFRLPQPRRAA
ncbi:MAG: HAMP domain-containing histidine kinase [Gammaproteobacteria bacterium]|nr:HAMP domain-containing histidine kinase [Gammaproteobacteria bacterium]